MENDEKDFVNDTAELDSTLEDVGVGMGQFVSYSVIFWLQMVGSMLTFLLFFFSKELSEEWGISSDQIAWLDVLAFLGIFLGWIPGCIISDFMGRRPCVLFSTLLISCISFYSGYCRSFVELCVFRFLLGVSIGIFEPASTSLALAISPPTARRRIAILVIGGATATGRALLASLVYTLGDQMVYEHAAISWRGIIVLCSFMSLLGLVTAAYNLVESPEWMRTRNMPEEAAATVAALAQDNGKPQAFPKGRRLAAPAHAAGAGQDLWLSLHHVVDDISILSQVSRRRVPRA